MTDWFGIAWWIAWFRSWCYAVGEIEDMKTGRYYRVTPMRTSWVNQEGPD